VIPRPFHDATALSSNQHAINLSRPPPPCSCLRCVVAARASLSSVSHRDREREGERERERETVADSERLTVKRWSCEYGGRRGRSSGFPECQNKNRWVLARMKARVNARDHSNRNHSVARSVCVYCENVWIFIQIYSKWTCNNLILLLVEIYVEHLIVLQCKKSHIFVWMTPQLSLKSWLDANSCTSRCAKTRYLSVSSFVS